jgi:hypothetical protein
MEGRDRPDPVRATLVAVLQQLNRIESLHEGNAHEQAVELSDLERLLAKFWAIEHDGVRVPVVLGLLLRNRLIQAVPTNGSAGRSRRTVRYRITAEGKGFLVGALEKSDRIG